jgi:hypothetical protein
VLLLLPPLLPLLLLNLSVQEPVSVLGQIRQEVAAVSPQPDLTAGANNASSTVATAATAQPVAVVGSSWHLDWTENEQLLPKDRLD